MGRDYLLKRILSVNEARTFVEGLLDHDWLVWKFAKDLYVSAGRYESYVKKIVESIASGEELEADNVRADDAVVAVVPAYEPWPVKRGNFRRFFPFAMPLATDGKSADEIFGMDFSRGYGFLAGKDRVYKPPLICLERRYRLDRQFKVPMPAGRFRTIARDPCSKNHGYPVERHALELFREEIQKSADRLVINK